MCKTKAPELNHILDMSLEKRDLDLVLHDPPFGEGVVVGQPQTVLESTRRLAALQVGASLS